MALQSLQMTDEDHEMTDEERDIDMALAALRPPFDEHPMDASAEEGYRLPSDADRDAEDAEAALAALQSMAPIQWPKRTKDERKAAKLAKKLLKRAAHLAVRSLRV